MPLKFILLLAAVASPATAAKHSFQAKSEPTTPPEEARTSPPFEEESSPVDDSSTTITSFASDGASTGNIESYRRCEGHCVCVCPRNSERKELAKTAVSGRQITRHNNVKSNLYDKHLSSQGKLEEAFITCRSRCRCLCKRPGSQKHLGHSFIPHEELKSDPGRDLN